MLAALLSAAALLYLDLTAVPLAEHARAATCRQLTGPFRQRDGRIWQANGRRFIPYGVTVSGLERPDWARFTAADTAEIDAAATVWCANLIRLQVSEQQWQNSAAFRGATASEIHHAETLGLVVVVNDNDQWSVRHSPMPTQRTWRFWRGITSRYRADPQVIFDLFNEPEHRIGRTTLSWRCWHDGGSACPQPGFKGMQPLARYVRRRAPNLIWIDGRFSQLDQVKSWPIWGARPMMYSVHHPQGPHTAANWSRQFGWLAQQRWAPVVDGEWTNFAARRGECWPDAPARVPAYLAYLQRLRIGMTVWKLGGWDKHGTRGGVLTTLDPTRPTGFGPPGQWRCVDGYHHTAGVRIQAWYALLNS
jgi:hypothetical protein